MSEHRTQQEIRLKLSRGPVRLFRNNVGTGWVGKAQQITAANRFTIGQTLRPGDVVVRNARPLHAGLCEGSSDLIGLRAVTVTPEMVGTTVALFAAVEVKAERGPVRPAQRQFLEAIQAMGGLAGVARSVEEAQAVLRLSGPGLSYDQDSPNGPI